MLDNKKSEVRLVTETKKESAIEKANKDLEAKKEILTKANEAAVKAHSDVMAAQLELKYERAKNAPEELEKESEK